jgi:hypothetical protein
MSSEKHSSGQRGEGRRIDTVCAILEEGFQQAYSQLEPIIGPSAAVAIFQNAMQQELAGDHPLSQCLHVSPSGPKLDPEAPDCGEATAEEMIEGGMMVINGVIAVLTTLTGDILSREVRQLAEQVRFNLGYEGKNEP